MNNVPSIIERWIIFKSEKDNPIQISDDQYAAIREVINTIQFIEINDRLYNRNDILRIDKIIKKIRRLNERGYYDVD